MFQKLYRWLRGLIARLLALKDTPHAIAGGVAIGMFMGFSPLVGLKTALAVGLAYLFRCNMIAAAIAVSLHDVFIPLMPVVLRFEYDLGYYLLHYPHQLPPKFDLHHSHFRPSDILNWSKYLDLRKEGGFLLLGSLFLSAPSAVISYYVTLAFLKARARNRALQEDAD